MRKVSLLATGFALLAVTGFGQTTGYLYYAGGVSADARTSATGLGVLDAGGTTPNTDAMLPTVYCADVGIGAASVTVSNWRSVADFDLGNPIPLDNPATGGTVESYSWIYVSHNVHQYNGHLYVGPGDWNGDTNFDTADIIVHAPIDAGTGGLGAWTFSSQLPTPLAINASGIVEVGGVAYLYVFGSVSEASCYYAEIMGDGTLGAWQTGTALPAADWFHGGTAVGDKLIYASGNLVGTPPQSHYNTIAAGGGMGSWTSFGDFTVGDEAAARWAYAIDTVTAPGGNPFVIATCGNGVASDDGVYTSEVTGGVPGAWAKQAAAVPVPVRNVSGVGVEDVFLVVGGATSNTAGASLNSVRVGRISAGGVVTWTDDVADGAVNALPETRSYGGLAFFETPPAASVTRWESYK